jgi:ribosomal protein S18 acetylase RimI-like enzyme
MLIRRCSSADIDQVMALVHKVVPMMRASGNLQWDEEDRNVPVFEKDVQLCQLWVANIEGEIAGFAAITTDQEPEYADVGWDIDELSIVVHRLAVDPAFQSKGIAAALILQAETVARERDVKVLRVDTNAQNQATQRLFPKLGYALAGEIKLGFRPCLNFLCYEKGLDLKS